MTRANHHSLSAAILVLGFLSIFLSSTLAQERCALARSGPLVGVCREIRQCPSVIEDLRRRIRFPISCGRFVGRFPIVCCPAGGTTTNPPQEPDISPPKGNLDCGRTAGVPGTALSIRRQSSPSPVASVAAEFIPGFVPSITVELIGAEPSLRASWPWMALLGDQDRAGNPDWFCAGSLINDQWILTAAHCIVERSVTVVRLGEHDFEDPNDGAPHQDFQVETAIYYPNYTVPQAYHDIALIKLTTRVRFQNAIRPVCLPWGNESKKTLVGDTVTVTGWGDTAFGGSRSPVLQEVQVTVFDSEVCNRNYRNLRDYTITWPQGIGAETICSGDTDGGKDACQGDSGGPMVTRNFGNRYILAGVVSVGYGCGSVDYPGLYANMRTPDYLAWVKRTAF